MSRDVQRLLRHAFHDGDVEGEDAYQRALDGGGPVSHVVRAIMLDQGLRFDDSGSAANSAKRDARTATHKQRQLY